MKTSLALILAIIGALMQCAEIISYLSADEHTRLGKLCHYCLLGALGGMTGGFIGMLILSLRGN